MAATDVLTGQLDLLTLLELENKPTAPLHFTVGHYHPDELDEAYAYRGKSEGLLGVSNWSRQWNEWQTGRNVAPGSPHRTFTCGADLRCNEHWRNPNCMCLGDLLYRIYCHDCDWWSGIHDSENSAVEDMLNHCWTGWQELPLVTATMKPGGGYGYKIPEDYPTDWQYPGAPVRTLREPMGSRHVPGRSPWGGYDIGVIHNTK
ncbi:DUF6349 family protein [Arthrobacter sp. fls2-241-R2A-172]|uniref:DUF6349 family protein n=1 Tax=Arthrobacter sp. fls2-241-R2A-172 TaxID=3040325 RepID=UPI00254F6BC4|nr:DUF6349 family protein [Arthrobacter sp. fls2-241-R2A-172]